MLKLSVGSIDILLLHNRFSSGQGRIQGKGDKLQLPFPVNSGYCGKEFKSMRSVRADGQAGCGRASSRSPGFHMRSAVLLCLLCFGFSPFAQREEGPARGLEEGAGRGLLG